MRALLTENTQQGRAMLRKLLDGLMDVEPLRDGRRGFRFRGTLTIRRIIAGEVSASLTGGSTAP